MWNVWCFFGMNLKPWHPFLWVDILGKKKNLDGPWCWILCVLARHCISYTTYQWPRLPNVPNCAQATTCDSQIVPNHRPRYYSCYPRKRNRLSRKSSLWFFFFKKKKTTCYISFLGTWNGIWTPLEFFYHPCASSHHPGITSSPFFAFSHSFCWNYLWPEYERISTPLWKDISEWLFSFFFFFLPAQQFALSHLGLRDYLLFAPRTSLISANKEGIISLPGKLNEEYTDTVQLELFPLSRLSHHTASGIVCRHDYSTTFPIFFPS